MKFLIVGFGRGAITLHQGRGEEMLRTQFLRNLKNVDSPFARRLLASQDEIVIEISPEKIYS